MCFAELIYLWFHLDSILCCLLEKKKRKKNEKKKPESSWTEYEFTKQLFHWKWMIVNRTVFEFYGNLVTSKSIFIYNSNITA